MSMGRIIIGSDNGLLPTQHQAITCTSVDKMCQLHPLEHISIKFKSSCKNDVLINIIWKCSLRNVGHSVQASVY